MGDAWPFRECMRRLMAQGHKLRGGKVPLDRIDRCLLSHDVRAAVADVARARSARVLGDDQPAERTPQRGLELVFTTGDCDCKSTKSRLPRVIKPIIDE